MDLRSKIILIYGPTASGKSEFAVKLAKKIKGEIINADSMQVYKELKILTARPLKNSIEVNSIILEAQKKKIKSANDLNQITNQVLNSNQKTILLVIYNSQNQRRYIGIKLK